MRASWLAISFLVLASCSEEGPEVCDAPESSTNETLESCIHRAAYQFARSDGSNSELANAAVTQCDTLVTEKAEGLLEIGVELAERRGEQGTTEQYLEARENYHAFVKDEARADALMRVIQARSGTCEPLA